ncbi:MAG: accessory factor UbiK family protein [Pseudomonadota bacterium]
MAKSNKIVEDLTQLAGSAAGIMNDVRQQVRDDVKARVEEFAGRMDLVPREDLEIVEAKLDKAMGDIAELQQRLDAVEKGK